MAVPPGAEGAGGPSGSLPVYGNVSAASKIFNPDIAVIGNFVGVGGKNDVRPEQSLAMREAEASFQAVVDPYARADFFMAFAEEGVDLEEGFVTFPTLPGGLLLKVGKMRAGFGKVNTFHTHQMPWPDRPLVTENLVGGEEGIADAGVLGGGADSQPVAVPRGDRPGLPRRLGRHLRRDTARRPELRGPAPRRIRTSTSRPTSISAAR